MNLPIETLLRVLLQELLLLPLLRAWCRPFRSGCAAELDDTPVVLVANHASHLDAPAILAALPSHQRRRLAIAAAEDYFYARRLPGWLASLAMGTFAFPRHGCVGIQRAQALLADGSSVLLFPEGTRSPDGTRGTFRHGVGHLLLASGVPVVPVAVGGSHALWPRGQRFPHRGPLAVHIGQPWTPPADLSAGAIAGELEERVNALASASVESDEARPVRFAWDAGHDLWDSLVVPRRRQ